MSEPGEDRLFRVRARDEDVRHGRLIREASPEAAAIAFVEHLALLEDLQDVSLVVHDMESGHDHSYRVILDSGDMPAVI